MSLRLFINTPLAIDQRVTLAPAASHYAVSVRRLALGDSLILFNGDAGEYHAVIEKIEKKQTIVSITAFQACTRESPLCTHLGQVISKGERMDYTIQKAVELGITTITPLYSERGQVHFSAERIMQKLSHWQAIAESASAQSGRTAVPIIHSPQPLAQWLIQVQGDIRIMCQPEATHAFRSLMGAPRSLCFAVGAEGGFTPKEYAIAQTLGWQGVHLGPRTLRTESVALTLLTLAQARWGDL